MPAALSTSSTISQQATTGRRGTHASTGDGSLARWGGRLGPQSTGRSSVTGKRLGLMAGGQGALCMTPPTQGPGEMLGCTSKYAIIVIIIIRQMVFVFALGYLNKIICFGV